MKQPGSGKTTGGNSGRKSGSEDERKGTPKGSSVPRGGSTRSGGSRSGGGRGGNKR